MEYDEMQRICIVYGDKENIEKFLESESWGGGILGDSEKINCVELHPKSDWFKETKKGIIKGFEE